MWLQYFLYLLASYNNVAVTDSYTIIGIMKTVGFYG